MVQNHYGNLGWKCPSCGANLSPSTVSCPYHNYNITTTPHTGTPVWNWPSAKEQENNMFRVQPHSVMY